MKSNRWLMKIRRYALFIIVPLLYFPVPSLFAGGTIDIDHPQAPNPAVPVYVASDGQTVRVTAHYNRWSDNVSILSYNWIINGEGQIVEGQNTPDINISIPITTPRRGVLSVTVDVSYRYYDNKGEVHDGNTAIDGTSPSAESIFHVVKAGLKSIRFISDHNILNDNNADWTDDGIIYTEPEWAFGGSNNPISQTKNTNLSAQVKIKVQPLGLPFTLMGGSAESCLNFDVHGISTGDDQIVEATADAPLPDKVTIINSSVDWNCNIVGTTCPMDFSGAHKIYVTYETPTGSIATERRIRWCCETCDGKSELSDIANKIYEALTNNEPPKSAYVGPNGHPNPPWLMMIEGCGFLGECIDLALLMRLQVMMLGGDASVGFVYASSDADCYSTSGNAFEHKSPLCPVHGDERLCYYYEGHWNNWEGVCEVMNTCYAVKFTKGTPLDIIRFLLGDNQIDGNYQAWRYIDE